ncbi:autophagy-related protein 9, partial [Phenoliferia sp. Uapishka_3]
MEILPATRADAPEMARVHRLSFLSGSIGRSILSPCTPQALDDHMIMRVNLYLSLPDKRLCKAVIDGKIVGWTWWDVPWHGQPVVMPKRTFPVGANVEFAGEFFEKMAKNAAPMPCYVYAEFEPTEETPLALATIDDPFSPTSPSPLSPASSSARQPLRSPPPPPPPPSSLHPKGQQVAMRDSRSPFHDEPIDSIYLSSRPHPHPNPSSSSSKSRSPTSSPPSRRRKMPGISVYSGGGMGGMSAMTGVGSSGIGNRSLMGLLGGTRYEPMGFDGIRVGADLLEEGMGEDEEGEGEEGASRMQAAEGERGRRLSDAQLAASLPPPPSAMSPDSASSNTEDEDEDDDDPPPDFTSRVPSSPTRRRHQYQRSPSSGGWGGLRIGGGGPVGGILGNPRASVGMGARERALWRWINVEDLDSFLQEVYLYYVGKGVWAISLSRALNLLTVGWVIFFSTFLLGCIDYSVLWQSHHLHEVVVDHCVSRDADPNDQYVNQFPKEKTALVSHFVAFLAGSFAAVLILFSLIDPDAFLHFEITPGRTVLFYITLFGGILAVARGMVPDENKVVDPEETMREIVEHTHYLPVEWRGKLHSAEVHLAFGQLFQMKVALFIQELLSVIVTPFVLWYTLPHCAGPIVDFFREFTVHVDGLGYVCSFAVFDFKRHGDTRFGAPAQAEADVTDRYKSKEGKMEKSFLNFTAQNPAWVPRDQTQSLFLSTLGAAHGQPSPLHTSNAILHRPPPFSSARSTSHSNRFRNPTSPPQVPAFATLANAGPSGLNTADKSKLYDRAFQRSTTGRHRPTTAARPLPPRERAIDEESGLDGVSYIATTTEHPWGAVPDGEDGEVGKGKEEEERLPDKPALKGLLSEMYDVTGSKW